MKLVAKLISYLCIAVLLILASLWLVLARPALLKGEPVNIEVNQDKLYQHVKTLSVDLVPRSYLDINNLNNAADYIKQQFELYGHKVVEQKFKIKDVEYRNILVHLGPENGSKVIVGAHYDAAKSFPGADDNASGVAGLIELSRLLANKEISKPLTLVAYAQEEPPFFATKAMGSFAHANNEYASNSDIELMISLEMIGYFSEQQNSQLYPLGILKLFYPSQGNFIAVIDRFESNKAYRVKKAMAASSNVPVYSINAPTFIPGVDFSDHRNFWLHGYDAVMVTDTAFYRNRHYHTDGDTIDKLNFEKMAEVIKGVYGFIQQREFNN